jgi:hypothetical protein
MLGLEGRVRASRKCVREKCEISKKKKKKKREKGDRERQRGLKKKEMLKYRWVFIEGFFLVECDDRITILE